VVIEPEPVEEEGASEARLEAILSEGPPPQLPKTFAEFQRFFGVQLLHLAHKLRVKENMLVKNWRLASRQFFKRKSRLPLWPSTLKATEFVQSLIAEVHQS